ncbi:succinate dehydrogenase [Imhoffiella purpurea]|uniref:Succinate dehydrogenase cytochrome b558 subunit n=1 Tax=Imhoffiella purpurea TaxID=1249627 RepID=W9VU67_9GAMM|nr:succinate dehydrogenase [Imhoffiella purpurea]EXJ13900.1 Succinate dehydrogenase cytochrome b558 subunit [Imhoffiella purpurea]
MGSAMNATLDPSQFLLRRLHSLLGLLPIGAFLTFHLWENSQSRFGAEHYNTRVVATLQEMNYLVFVELFVIALPLLFHAAYGLAITGQMRAELSRYPYARNRFYWLQRISGVGILVFLLLHVGTTRLQGLWQPAVRDDLYGHMQGMLSDPLVFGFYALGLLLSVFHLANGLSTMAIVWGLTTSARAQRLFGYVCTALGLVLGAIGIHGLLGFLP